MSYEISNAKDDTTSPGKYSKRTDDEECEHLLQETSLDEEPDDGGLSKDEAEKAPTFSEPEPTQVQAPEPPLNQLETASQTSSQPSTKPVASSSPKVGSKKTTKSSSHKSFELSIASFIRFLSFRKKKNKAKQQTDTSSVTTESSSSRTNKYHSLPKRNQSKAKSEDSSKADKEETDKPTVFSRFVRTFSFLYKRNPNSASATSNFKRSQSVQNYRQTRSLPDIKYSSQSRALNSPGSSSGSTARQNVVSNVKHSNAPGEPANYRRDRAKSDVQPRHRVTQTNHINVTSVTVKNAGAVLKPDTTVETDSGGKAVDLKESRNEVVPHASSANRRRHLVSSGLETPAVCGIQNHGNTCFINSVIQCLSNTDLLAEYFVYNHYREDLLHHRLSTKKYGTRGELTEHLAVLLKSLWSCMYSSDISMKFKKIVSKYGEQYNGYEQHDAQEFLLWLLDKCHEDLTVQSPKNGNNKNSFLPFKKTATNSNTKKTAKKSTSDFYVTDEAAAIESLAKYQTVDATSIVYDLFQGQLRSMVVCRNCDHYSKTFDPYLCLSLPVPIRLTLTIFIHAIFVEKERNQSGMYGISIEAAATLRELRDKISRMLKIPERRLILLQVDKKYGMIEFSNDADMIQEIFEDFETIFALETPIIPEHESNTELLIDTSDTTDATPKEGGNTMYQQMLTVVWLNRVGIGQEGPIFGPLFTIVLSRESTFRKLQSLILSTMSDYLIDSANVNCDEISRNINLRLRVVGGLPGKEYLASEVDHPLFVPTVECALSKTEDRRTYRGPHHLKLMVEWDLDIRRSIIVGDDEIDAIFDKNARFMDKSVERAKERSSLNNRTTLQDCLDIYFREESLTADNAWMCPMCNSRQQCVKQLSVWTLPNIFIIHLKRFRFMSNVRRIKINTMVEYPQNGLDMLNYVAQRKFSTSDSASSKTSNGFVSNCSKFSHKRKLTNSIEETTYNLYGVACHHGTMQGGHYTAYCKNPVDNCWYLFDDTKVIPVLEEAVVTPDAYLLFYQKSSLSTTNVEPKANPSTSSISSGYLSSVTCSSNFNLNHWAFQMPPFNYYSNGSNGNNKSNTLPNRRGPMQPKAMQQQHASATNGHTTNSHPSSNVKSPNYEAIKHSSSANHSAPAQQNGGKKYEPSSASSNYNHTFPRIKSRQASH